MNVPAAARDLASLRECKDCGLVQRLPAIPDGERATCIRCDATLRRAARDSLTFARISTLVCATLFVLALGLPFVEMRVLGRFTTSTLFTGPEMLRQRGLPGLAMVVLFTLVLMPAVKLSIELMVLFGVRSERPPPWLPWLFGWIERVAPWSMVEVFLLGAFVAYTRLRVMADVTVGPALYALGGVMLSMVATDGTLDREAIWQELEAKATRLDRNPGPDTPPTAGARRIIGCHDCGRIAHAEEDDRCVRCGHRLSHRKKNSLGRVWAMLLTAMLLYIPANIFPVMTVLRMGRGGPSTILGGVVELAEAHMWPLALLVLLASVIVPMLKLVSLAVMLIMTHRRSTAFLRGRTRMFRFVHAIGRWSMIDIFMLATLVGVVRLGFISTILPGLGAGAFCAVVIVTMVATELFDPRLMWDAAAAKSGDARVPEALHRHG